jgi:hypothetical protein
MIAASFLFLPQGEYRDELASDKWWILLLVWTVFVVVVNGAMPFVVHANNADFTSVGVLVCAWDCAGYACRCVGGFSIA